MKWINPIAVLILCSSALAAAPDVSGKWKWKYERSNGESTDVVMNLKQDGSKLSGTIQAADVELKVQDGKVAPDGQVTFAATLERDSGPLKIAFSGKAEGDKLVGK